MAPAVKQEIDLLDRAVAKGGFLAGDSFTLADINVMPILAYLKNFPEAGRGDRGSEVTFGLLSTALPRVRAFRRRRHRRDRRQKRHESDCILPSRR